MLQSVRRHSAVVLTVTVNAKQQIHPVDTRISPIKVQSQLVDYGLWGFYRVPVKIKLLDLQGNSA